MTIFSRHHLLQLHSISQNSKQSFIKLVQKALDDQVAHRYPSPPATDPVRFQVRTAELGTRRKPDTVGRLRPLQSAASGGQYGTLGEPVAT